MTSRLVQRSRCIPFFLGLVAVTGCGKAPNVPPSVSFQQIAPAEYRGFVQNGKQVPTGNAALDYWVGVNIQFCILREFKDAMLLAEILRSHAKGIRNRPVYGIDPDLVTWAHRAADGIEKQATLLAQTQNPALYGDLSKRSESDQQRVLDQLQQLGFDLQAEFQRVAAEGNQLQSSLSRRHNRPFPPCLFSESHSAK